MCIYLFIIIIIVVIIIIIETAIESNTDLVSIW